MDEYLIKLGFNRIVNKRFSRFPETQLVAIFTFKPERSLSNFGKRYFSLFHFERLTAKGT